MPQPIATRRRPKRLPLKWALAALACLLLSHRPATALDADRALTQALLRKWQIQQGLPEPTVTTILQSRSGTLWLGTPSGLYEFDGVRFDPALVLEGQSLDDVWINDLCEDGSGAIWIATRSHGLLSLKDGEVTSHGAPVGFPLRRVHCLAVDSRGTLWAGGEGGLAEYRDRTFRRYQQRDGLPIANVFDLAPMPNGGLWIAGDGPGLCAFQQGKFRPINDMSNSTVRSLLLDARQTLWIGAEQGLYRLKEEEHVPSLAVNELEDAIVECLAQTREGTIWAGTRDGLYRLRSDGPELFGTREGLTQSTVLTICEDHEGSLWVGTKHGLNQLSDRRTLPLTTAEGLPSNEAGPIIQDGERRIWIGTLGAGLAFYDGRRCQPAASASTGLPSGRVSALARGRNDEVWVGTDRGLCLLKDNQVARTWTTADGLPADDVNCLLCDDDGVVWIGTSNGVARLRDGTLHSMAGTPVGSGDVSVLVSAREQRVLAATSDGVFQIQRDAVTRINGDPAWMKQVTAIHVGPDGEYWIACRGRGLKLIQNRRGYDIPPTKFMVVDGLFDDEISGIAADRTGQLWMGCSRGIFSVSRRQLYDFANGRRRNIECWSLSPTDALRTVECQRGVQPALTRTRDGVLYFSTIHGVLVVNPSAFNRSLPIPKVEVTRLMINGRPVATHKPATAPPGEFNLSVRFTAHTYAAPTRTLFRYQLLGYDRDWVHAGSRREAFYTNLAPGTYQFLVSAMNPGDPWAYSSRNVSLTLEPSFWQTRWFPIVVAVGVLALLLLFLRLREYQVRSRMNTILAERTRIARELHDTLIQGFSGVTMQMQALSARMTDPQSRETLDGIVSDAGVCLREARQSVAGLRSAQGASLSLPAAIAEAARQLTETRDVKLHLQLPDDSPVLPVETEFNLLRIAQEAIANAARHAHARTIDVSLVQKPGRLALSVRDDGVGFSVAEREAQPNSHYGLIGMRERSRQISADLTIDSRPGAGTVVLVDLPLAHTDGPPAGSSQSTTNSTAS